MTDLTLTIGEDEAVERIARAIYEARMTREHGGFTYWSMLHTGYKSPWMDEARAVVAALKEPSMTSHHPNPDLSPEGVEETWTIYVCSSHPKALFAVPGNWHCSRFTCSAALHPVEVVPASALQAERQLRQEHEAEIERLNR